MSLELPLVSIIIAAYNAQKYIEKCLHSCLEQTYQNIEIILVDDGSEDGTVALAQNLTTDSRMRIVRNESNLGTFEARLVGLHNARGDFVAFVDSDDHIAPEFCEAMLAEFAQKGDSIDMVACQYFVEPIGVLRHTCTNLYETLLGSQIWKLYRTTALRGASALCARILASYDTRELVGLEDVLFSLFLLPSVRGFGYVAAPLYFYADNPESMTRQPSIRYCTSAARSLALVETVLCSPTYKIPPAADDYLHTFLMHTKYNFYIYQRHNQELVCLDGSIKTRFVYLQALMYAAYFEKPLRCALRALGYCATFGTIRR